LPWLGHTVVANVLANVLVLALANVHTVLVNRAMSLP
jgi:hypothetical protein